MDNISIQSYLAQLGNRKDPKTGAVSAPIYLSTAYGHPGLGQSTGYDYTRTANPTRDILQEGLAVLENGVRVRYQLRHERHPARLQHFPGQQPFRRIQGPLRRQLPLFPGYGEKGFYSFTYVDLSDRYRVRHPGQYGRCLHRNADEPVDEGNGYFGCG